MEAAGAGVEVAVVGAVPLADAVIDVLARVAVHNVHQHVQTIPAHTECNVKSAR